MRRSLVLAAALAVAVALAWWNASGVDPSSAGVANVAATPIAAASSQPAAASLPQARPALSANSVALARPQSDATSAACDVAASAPKRGAASEPSADTALRNRQALQQLDAALARRPTERAAAARHYIAMVGAANEALAAQQRDGKNCNLQSCEPALDAARTPARNAIARMALRTADPAVYAVALQACGFRREQDCQMISTRQWARLDPDNAVPWLHLAGEATAQADESGLAEAVFHIAHARRSESYSGVVTHEALAALPLEQQGVQALPLLSAELTWSLPPMQTTARYCNDDATRDANRRLVCGDVADTLLQRGSTLIERRIGRRIAQRAGWPAAMLAALDEETDALMYALRQQLVPDAEAGDCANKLAIGRYVRLLAEHGEVGAAREAMRRGGRSIAELAAAYRAERLALREKEAARAAASAAATPP